MLFILTGCSFMEDVYFQACSRGISKGKVVCLRIPTISRQMQKQMNKHPDPNRILTHDTSMRKCLKS
jgi:hypothetical protein